jgi:hypothetical protein
MEGVAMGAHSRRHPATRIQTLAPLCGLLLLAPVGCGPGSISSDEPLGQSAERLLAQELADASGDSLPCDDPGPGLAALMATMDGLGYDVQCGRIRYSNPALDGTGSWGNNPSTWYGTLQMPPHPGAASEVLSPAFWLQPGEAIMTVMVTPPEVHYFGFQSYLFYRTNPLPAGPAMVDIFASLGDAANARTIRGLARTQEELDARDQRFGDLVATVTTADKLTRWHGLAGLAAMMGDGSAGRFLASKMENLEMLPAYTLQMGIGEDKDVFASFMRVTPFDEDEDPDGARYHDAVAYMENPPIVVLRLTPRDTSRQSGFFTRADVEARLRTRPIPPADSAREVEVLADTFGVTPDLLDMLDQAVVERYGQGRTVEERAMLAGDINGYDCIDRFDFYVEHGLSGPMAADRWCAGDTRDTAYLVAGDLVIGAEDVVVVTGVNHVVTEMATYINLAVNNQEARSGVYAMLDFQMTGSAGNYLDAGGDEDTMYAVAIARDCTGIPTCLKVPTPDEDPDGGIPLVDNIVLAVRAYVNQDTAVGSAYEDLVMPRVLIFSD